MSYCRFGTGDPPSDVYVIHDLRGGWTTYCINGDQHNDPTPGICAERLERLARDGLTVPLSVIDQLRVEDAGATR